MITIRRSVLLISPLGIFFFTKQVCIHYKTFNTWLNAKLTFFNAYEFQVAILDSKEKILKTQEASINRDVYREHIAYDFASITTLLQTTYIFNIIQYL